jgi:hypothetical protein
MKTMKVNYRAVHSEWKALDPGAFAKLQCPLGFTHRFTETPLSLTPWALFRLLVDIDMEEFEAPQWCVPIKANVMNFDWDVSFICRGRVSLSMGLGLTRPPAYLGTGRRNTVRRYFG